MSGLTLPRWLWYPEGGCTVEVLRTGHYPSTVMVRKPDDTELEVELTNLAVPNNITQPKL